MLGDGPHKALGMYYLVPHAHVLADGPQVPTHTLGGPHMCLVMGLAWPWPVLGVPHVCLVGLYNEACPCLSEV